MRTNKIRSPSHAVTDWIYCPEVAARPLIYIKIPLFSVLNTDYFLFSSPTVAKGPPVFIRAIARAVPPLDFIYGHSKFASADYLYIFCHQDSRRWPFP